MNLEELLSKPVGSVIQLKDGTRLVIDENDNYEGNRMCFGINTNKKCYFLKDKDGNWMKQNCPGSKGYCEHCYVKLEDGEPRPKEFVKTGAETITKERLRQKVVEGWTPEHDDEHSNQELIKAAKCYIEANLYRATPSKPPIDWPWGIQYWKAECSSESINNLRKAGALIAAEIDRLNKLKEYKADYIQTEE